MKYMNLWKPALVILVAFAWSTALRADSLNVALTEANQTVVQGTAVVAFEATVSNPSSNTDTLFLNGDSSTTASPLVTVDDSPFNPNAPIFLAPGDSSGPFLMFNVDLDPSLGPGLYTGDFSILGGADGGTNTDFADLADVNFSVDVTSPVATPEPGVILLLGAGLTGLFVLRRRADTVS